MSTSRRMELEVALAATPEQVWEAIATGPGISSWFVPTTVDGEAGTIRQDFGSGFVVDGRVTATEPGRRFAYGGPEAPADAATGEQPNYAFEFLVEGRDGGSAVLRFVQSGFLDRDGWEAEYDSFEHGWKLFFHNLSAYLEHFAGRISTTVVSMGYTPIAAGEAWAVFYEALGLAKRPSPGDEVRLTPDGLPPIEGVVDVSTDQFLGVRSAEALYRFGAEGTTGCGVSAYHYFYGAVDVDAARAGWQEWLSALFPAPLPAEPAPA